MKTTQLLLTAVLSLNLGFAQQNDSQAPEATAVEDTLSFRDIPDLKEAFIDTAPADRKDGILVSKLGVDGGNKAMIVSLAQEIADSKHGNYDALLISHKNKLVFESYYKKGRVNLPHFQSSATKGYTTLALGRAIQLGYLTMADLDKPLVSFLKDLDPTKFVKGVEKITLHKAMTMHSGIRISDDKRKELEENPSQLKGQGLVQAWLEHSAPITTASQSYSYSFDPDLVMQVIDAVVPGTAQDFIKNELLNKMGITNYRWRTGVSGLPEAGWRVSMTSRDMVKWGTLVLNNGKWNGEQLVPEAFVTKATSGITQPTEDWQPKTYRYGYFWYQTSIQVADKSYTAKFAWGGGGIHLIVLEELELVIAITGHDREDTIMAQVSETIIPAFVKDEFPVLEGPYLGQKPPGLTPEVFAPGIVTTEDWGDAGVFSQNMNVFYVSRWRVHNEKLERKSVTFKKIANRWHVTDDPGRTGTPSFSPDGKTMHFGSKYKERTATGWSEEKSLGASFEEIRIMGLTASGNGTLAFDEVGTDGDGLLRYSRLVDGKREDPKPFGKEINTGTWNAHPFIAPDESYIMWDGERESGYGSSDIYISFRQKDGSWGEAINLGDQVNTEAEEGGPRITPDGKYLFFNRMVTPTSGDGRPQSDLFWVDAQIIENLKPKE